MKKNAATIGLVRHSITLWNEKKIIQGQEDSPLSEKGKKIAATWGAELSQYHWDRILTSDLGRAMATAALINRHLNLPCTSDSGLREQDWGKWNGASLAQIKKKKKKRLKGEVAKGWLFQPPEGESRQQVLVRAEKALLSACAQWPEENILVICHEGVIKCLLYHLKGRAFLPTEPPLLKRYHLHLLTVQGNRLRLGSINHHKLPA